MSYYRHHVTMNKYLIKHYWLSCWGK